MSPFTVFYVLSMNKDIHRSWVEKETADTSLFRGEVPKFEPGDKIIYCSFRAVTHLE